MTTLTFPDFTGMIFHRIASHGTSPGYWKITGPAKKSVGCYSYPVVKCSKLGKEYKTTNGFSVAYVTRLNAQGLLYSADTQEKASTDGKASGIRKRRIDFLVKSMHNMVEELNGLLELEARSEVYELIAK